MWSHGGRDQWASLAAMQLPANSCLWGHFPMGATEANHPVRLVGSCSVGGGEPLAYLAESRNPTDKHNWGVQRMDFYQLWYTV